MNNDKVNKCVSDAKELTSGILKLESFAGYSENELEKGTTFFLILLSIVTEITDTGREPSDKELLEQLHNFIPFAPASSEERNRIFEVITILLNMLRTAKKGASE